LDSSATDTEDTEVAQRRSLPLFVEIYNYPNPPSTKN